MEPRKRKASPLPWFLIFFLTFALCGVKALSEGNHHGKSHDGPVVEKDQRRTLLTTEYGEITAIDVNEGHKELPYHLQFITLEPNSLFLPVLLHADMVFYVHTGSGKLTWANDDDTSTISLRQGDLCSLNEGSVFYIQSNLESERIKLRIYAMFANTDDNTYDPSIGAYSRINELVKGFDKKIMQAALKVPEDLIEAITKSNTPAIVHAVSEKKKNIVQELEASFLKNFVGDESNSKKLKTYNIFDHDPDFKNHNGWSIAVTKKQLKSLKRTNIGFFMVHLSLGSILGPHWNPKATELSMVVQGRGMVRAVCGSGNDNEKECQNMRFKVNEGDAFVVPRFHPMAQMSFEDEPFVFLGFSTSAKKNHPQFLAGKGSVLHVLDKQIMAKSFGVSNKTVDKLLHSPEDSIIFRCGSCAEEEQKIMKEEEEKERKEPEEEKKKEEEEKKRDEEEARKKEEEERKRKQEEEARKREKERKREEEEARKKERERKREEEEARKKERERKREEEEAKEEREEEKAGREKEEREREREREEKARKERKREEEREREEEVEREEEGRREKERRRKREAEAKREQEKRERRRQEKEARREAAQRKQEQARREEEAAARREQEQAKREEEESAQSEEEQAKREQERRERRRREETEREEEQEGREEGEEEEETTGTEQEQEQAERQQQRRERKRQEEEQREREEGEVVPWRKRGERQRREKVERPEEEEGTQWEQEEARRQQEQRERSREREGDNEHTKRENQSHRSSFEGRRILKMRNV